MAFRLTLVVSFVACPCSVVPQVRSPQYPHVRSTRGAVRGEGPPVLRVLRLIILLFYK